MALISEGFENDLHFSHRLAISVHFCNDTHCPTEKCKYVKNCIPINIDKEISRIMFC